MININTKHLAALTVVTFTLLLIYSFYYIFNQRGEYLINSKKEKDLQEQFQTKHSLNNSLSLKIRTMQKEIDDINSLYISSQEIESNIKKLFKTISTDYDASLIGLKELCVNRYIIVVQLGSNDQRTIEGFQKIISRIGEFKRSKKDTRIYFIDYLMEGKK
ncbi:MAG: hypothetical protein U9Q33_11130 [Campylobacterota bacterium]|nr:hypothetical protein [Campylobacterota bacterium]